jgi:alcohol dehydrogenase (cytochrome c)
VTIAGEVPNFVPLTDAMLRNPAPGDWPMIRRDYAATDYSPLDEITRENVRNLELVYMIPMGEGGTNQAAPIAYNGIIYLAYPGNDGVIQAIDGATGEVIWEHRTGGNIARRGIAVYDDKVYFSWNSQIRAISAVNGEAVWATDADHSNSSGPIVANGKVIQGSGGCSSYGVEKCFLGAYDAQTGEPAWRFYTIATSDQPGGDSWGGLPDYNRAGGEMWITGSYDPDLNLTYWGTAQAKPWMPLTRGTNSDGLYSNSTIAVDVETGELARTRSAVSSDRLSAPGRVQSAGAAAASPFLRLPAPGAASPLPGRARLPPAPRPSVAPPPRRPAPAPASAPRPSTQARARRCALRRGRATPPGTAA